MTLIESIIETLSGEIRISPTGAKTLDHVCVTVPTAQSGRRLRLALAKSLGSVVPPAVVLPDRLLLDSEDPSLADRSDELVAFVEAGEFSVEHAARLSDLRRILSEKALSFADVAEYLESAADLPEALADEAARWRDLAELEAKYYAALSRRGRRDRIDVMKAGPPPLGYEKVLRYDLPESWAAPDRSVAFEQVFPAGTAQSEAQSVAQVFAAVAENEEPPALCVADPDLYPELVSAFKARGITLHNPAATRLASSSLGHLVSQLAELLVTPSYNVFSAFVRGGDVRAWLCRELTLTEDELTAAMVDLDNRQQEYLPERIDDIAPRTSGELRAIFEFVKVQLRKKGVRELLESIFRDRRLDERDEESREFAAAAEAVSRILGECERQEVSSALRHRLLAFRLEEETYSLEPDEGTSVIADGWMELPFLDSRELVIVGFGEHRVPESVVGHPYLPDSLRTRLGLSDNVRRTLRDRAILALALSARDPRSVRISFHGIDRQGDVLKPSRLLLETADDLDLCRRVRSFYASAAGTGRASATDLPNDWKLALPIPPACEKLKKISPTRLDAYLRCPFTYFLRRKDILGDKRLDDRAEELASWEYGNLAHEALERWAASDLRDSTDSSAIASFLETDVDRQLVERFGLAIPAIVAMQGESVKLRLVNFAAVQSVRRAAGWKIVAAEERLEAGLEGVRLEGKCDRVDHNEATGEWCVIDYKTWDDISKAKALDEKTGKWKSLQLPLYCSMISAVKEGPLVAAREGRICAAYCVLGKNADNVGFTDPIGMGYVGDAEKTALRLVRRIEKGIFWPPGPSGEWKWDYNDWLGGDPLKSVEESWIADQERRLGEADDDR